MPEIVQNVVVNGERYLIIVISGDQVVFFYNILVLFDSSYADVM